MNTENYKEFWDNQASDYSKNTMTNKSAEEEMKYIHEKLNTLNITKLSCLGAADGVREPIAFLNYLKEIRKALPKQIFINDISDSMIEKAKENVEKYTQENANDAAFQYLAAPIQIFSPKIFNELKNLKNSVFVLGCYSSLYILKALNIYKQEKNRIGTKFTLQVLLLLESATLNEKKNTAFEIKAVEKIDFDINEECDYLPKVETFLQRYWRKPEFYAFCVESDNNFISHYFARDCLNLLLRSVFKTEVLSSLDFSNQQAQSGDENLPLDIENPKRYVVSTIQNGATPDHLISMLNNVLGNIHFSDHIQVLELISDLFFTAELN